MRLEEAPGDRRAWQGSPCGGAGSPTRAAHIRTSRTRDGLGRDYEQLRTETLRALASKLAARRLPNAPHDLDDCYQDAWHALYGQLTKGVDVLNPVGFLVEVGYRRMVDELRRRRGMRDVALAAAEPLAVDDDVVARVDDRRRVREFLEGLSDQLGERERRATILCSVHGLSRTDAAKAIGVSEGRMKKIMDETSGTVGRLRHQIQTGRHCESRASTNTAFALGLLDPQGKRYAAARAHLVACSGCRDDVLRMRRPAAATA